MIKYDDYLSAREIFSNKIGFSVCSLKDGDCAAFLNLDNYNQLKSEMQSD